MDKEFDRLWEKCGGRKACEGDSPYTQEFVDELFHNDKKKKKVKGCQ